VSSSTPNIFRETSQPVAHRARSAFFLPVVILIGYLASPVVVRELGEFTRRYLDDGQPHLLDPYLFPNAMCRVLSFSALVAICLAIWCFERRLTGMIVVFAANAFAFAGGCVIFLPGPEVALNTAVTRLLLASTIVSLVVAVASQSTRRYHYRRRGIDGERHFLPEGVPKRRLGLGDVGGHANFD
jgi:hypothetical protein